MCALSEGEGQRFRELGGNQVLRKSPVLCPALFTPVLGLENVRVKRSKAFLSPFNSWKAASPTANPTEVPSVPNLKMPSAYNGNHSGGRPRQSVTQPR